MTLKCNEIYHNDTKHWEVLVHRIYKDGVRELVQEVSYNIVVESLSIVIACLLKRASGYTGITYLALGSGSVDWPEDAPPSPEDSDTSLEVETYRKAITLSDIVFIDVNNAVSETPTGRLQVTVAFSELEANGKLLEFGLFAGNATATTNSGYMINHKTHPIITKTEDVKLEYTIRLTF